jgi:hypothetical protein
MTTKTAPTTILLRGRGLRREAPAGGAITPGHLVAYNSSGNLVVHGTAGAKTRPLFAVENELLGKGINDAYAVNDLVQAEELHVGDVYALLPAAAAAIVIGDKLTSNGDGTLKKATAASQSGTTPFTVTFADHIIAEALEAVDNSGGGTPVRIKVAVIG